MPVIIIITFAETNSSGNERKWCGSLSERLQGLIGEALYYIKMKKVCQICKKSTSILDKMDGAITLLDRGKGREEYHKDCLYNMILDLKDTQLKVTLNPDKESYEQGEVEDYR